MDKQWIRKEMIEFLANRNVHRTDYVSEDDLIELSKHFLSMVEFDGSVCHDIEGVLMEIDFRLLRDFVDESKKHEGVVISDVPELKKKFDDVEEFLKYTEKFFGYRYNETKYCFEKIQKEGI